MTKNELNQYIEAVNAAVTLSVSYSDNGAIKVVFSPPDFPKAVAIADNIAELVVSDTGDYRPELKDLLLLYHVLNEASDIEDFGEGQFDESHMFRLLNSELGVRVMEELPLEALWMLRLARLADEKIQYRRSLLCNPLGPVNQKIAQLACKELETQKALYDSLQSIREIHHAFTPEQLKEFMKKMGDFSDMMKNPELNDQFFEDTFPEEV